MTTDNKDPPMGSSSEKNDALLGVKVSKRLFKQIQHHVHQEKCSNHHRFTQIDWIQAAIEKKLQAEGDSPDADSLQGVSLAIRLPRKLLEQIDQKLDLLKESYEKKGTRGQYSRRSWIIDAIEKEIEQSRNTSTSDAHALTK